MKYKFWELQWLKCSNGEYNYARIVGLFLLSITQPALIIYILSKWGISDVNNMWQWAIMAMPSTTAIFLFVIEVWRDIKNTGLHLKVGDKEIEVKKGD